VPEACYTTPIGKAAIAKPGKDATIVAVGPMVGEALNAAQALHDEGIYVEVIDLRTTRPIDNETILSSVAKTGRLVVADADWGPCGVAGEIVARVAEHAWDCLRAQPTRVHWPESSVPSGFTMEKDFYPGASNIRAAVHKVFGGPGAAQHNIESTIKQFEGPF
jgi:pyruvate/2-oxoglutarate/acetoin dehydrogenase E1 component